MSVASLKAKLLQKKILATKLRLRFLQTESHGLLDSQSSFRR